MSLSDNNLVNKEPVLKKTAYLPPKYKTIIFLVAILSIFGVFVFFPSLSIVQKFQISFGLQFICMIAFRNGSRKTKSKYSIEERAIAWKNLLLFMPFFLTVNYVPLLSCFIDFGSLYNYIEGNANTILTIFSSLDGIEDVSQLPDIPEPEFWWVWCTLAVNSIWTILFLHYIGGFGLIIKCIKPKSHWFLLLQLLLFLLVLLTLVLYLKTSIAMEISVYILLILASFVFVNISVGLVVCKAQTDNSSPLIFVTIIDVLLLLIVFFYSVENAKFNDCYHEILTHRDSINHRLYINNLKECYIRDSIMWVKRADSITKKEGKRIFGPFSLGMSRKDYDSIYHLFHRATGGVVLIDETELEISNVEFYKGKLLAMTITRKDLDNNTESNGIQEHFIKKYGYPFYIQDMSDSAINARMDSHDSRLHIIVKNSYTIELDTQIIKYYIFPHKIVDVFKKEVTYWDLDLCLSKLRREEKIQELKEVRLRKEEQYQRERQIRKNNIRKKYSEGI